MTSQTIRVKVQKAPTVKVKAGVSFPARLIEGGGVSIDQDGNLVTLALDYTDYAELQNFDPSQQIVLAYDQANDSYALIPLSLLLTNPSTIQEITGAGDVIVTANTRLLIMNRAVDESPSNIIMPPSTGKVGGCKIIDWKGNADAYPHTVSLNGSEKFQGNQSTWSISAPGASIVIDPVPGKGYAV